MSAGCGRSPGPADQPRAPAGIVTAPPALLRACRAAQSHVGFPIECPRRWPKPSRPDRPKLRALIRSRATYILDGENGFGTRPYVFHVVLAGQRHPFGAWPAGVDRRTGLADPAGTRRIASVRIGATIGVVFRSSPYPHGGILGGHIGVAWNEGSHGYIASVHGYHLSRRALVAAAVALARSSRPEAAP